MLTKLSKRGRGSKYALNFTCDTRRGDGKKKKWEKKIFLSTESQAGGASTGGHDQQLVSFFRLWGDRGRRQKGPLPLTAVSLPKEKKMLTKHKNSVSVLVVIIGAQIQTTGVGGKR